MRSTKLFFIGALAGAGAFALASSLWRMPQRTQVEPVQDTGTASFRGHDAGQLKDPALAGSLQASEQQQLKHADQSASERSGERNAFEPGTDSEWNALVGGMLEWEVERRSGRKLSAEQRDRLLSELARLREASLALQEVPAQPDDPAEIRERLTRTLALVQVDETFRRELGVGVADFLKELDPRAVDDVSPAPPEH